MAGYLHYIQLQFSIGPSEGSWRSKETYFQNQRTLIHRIFSVKTKLSDPFPKEWYLYFHSLCSICHKKLCIFLPKREKIGMMSVIWWDNLGKYTGNNFAYNKEKVEIHKLRWERKKVIILSGFSRSSGYEGCQSYYCSNGFQLFDLERGSLCCKVS